MLGKLLLLFAFIIFCSGCSTLSIPEESGKHTASTIPTAKSAQAQNIRFSPTYKSDETDKYYDAIEIYDSSPKASQGIYLYEGRLSFSEALGYIPGGILGGIAASLCFKKIKPVLLRKIFGGFVAFSAGRMLWGIFAEWI